VIETNRQEISVARQAFSRRSFGRFAAMLAASTGFNEFALAQVEIEARRLPNGAVKIDNNENPLGPCKESLDAIATTATDGGRYMFFLPAEMQELFASQEGVKQNYVQVHDGSSAPLLQAVLSFTSPTRPFVTVDPGYEAGREAADFLGAQTVRVPLRKDYSHDVKAMAAVPNAGLIYVCNPNNPTGSMTPKQDIAWLVANKPSGSVVMIDEAYIHFAGKEEHTCMDMVAADKDVIILRTFSKIYGMAGLRCGLAVARPDLLRKTRGMGIGWNPTTTVRAAMAALKSKSLVAERRRINADVRDNTVAFLQKKGFPVIPSVSNKFMVDTKRPTRDAIAALRKELIYVGRPWPSLPTHIRVSVGTRDEMAKFQQAFAKCFA